MEVVKISELVEDRIYSKTVFPFSFCGDGTILFRALTLLDREYLS